MGSNRLRWPNVERAAREYLAGMLTVPVLTRTGKTPPSRYVLIERTGGTGSTVDKSFDIEVTAVAGTRNDLWDLVADVESAMFALSASVAGDVYVDDVRDVFGFAHEATANPDERRAIATFALTVRPVRVT